MLYSRIKAHSVSSYLLFIIIAAGISLFRYFNPYTSGFYEGENQMVLFWPIFSFLQQMPYAPEVLGALMFVFSAFLVQRISFEFGFFDIRTLLPGTLFLLIAGGLNQFSVLHPVFPALMFFLMAVFQLFGSFDQRKPYSPLFNAGLLLGVGSLFYLHLIFLLPAFLIAAKLLARETRWREPLVLMLGALLPWVFTTAIYYLAGNITALWELLVINTSTSVNRFSGNIPLMGLSGFLLFLIFLGSISILWRYDEKKVSIRQYYLVFFLFFVSAVFSILFVPSVSAETLVIAAVPLTFLIANLILSARKNIWGELVIYALIAAIILQQVN